MKKYTIEVDESQAKTLVRACELFARINMGQLDVISEEFPDHMHQDFLRHQLKTLPVKPVAIHEGSDHARISWDLYQTIRYRLAWDKNPEGGHTVDFSPPIKYGNSELAKIRIRK